jgi:hypothetical protein
MPSAPLMMQPTVWERSEARLVGSGPAGVRPRRAGHRPQLLRDGDGLCSGQGAVLGHGGNGRSMERGGAFTAYDGTKVLLAGTSAHLYALTSTTATIKATIARAPWYFAQFGNFVDRRLRRRAGEIHDHDRRCGGSWRKPAQCLDDRDRARPGVPRRRSAAGDGHMVGAQQCRGLDHRHQPVRQPADPRRRADYRLAGGEYGLVFQSAAITSSSMSARR